jgi:hypothetical protein
MIRSICSATTSTSQSSTGTHILCYGKADSWVGATWPGTMEGRSLAAAIMLLNTFRCTPNPLKSAGLCQVSCPALLSFLSCALLPGFKPVSALADYHQLSPSRFVYPDERSLKGSTAAFAALHSACLMKGRSGSRWSHPLFPAACSCGVCLSWWACIPQHGITAPLLLVGLGIVHTLKCLHPTFSIASASLVALLAPFVATLLLYAGGASCHPLHMVNSVPPHLAL